MFKLPFFIFALGAVLYVVRYNNRHGRLNYRRVTRSIKSSITADPVVDQNMIAEGMKKMQLGLSKAMEKLGGGGGASKGGAMDALTGIASKVSAKLAGKNRSKRSIETSYTETNINKTNYRKVEMRNKSDKDHEQQQVERTCLVKDNEIYWLELVNSVLIRITQEMMKVLHGKTISYKMPSGAYNRTKPMN